MPALVVHTASTKRRSNLTFVYNTVVIHIDQPHLMGIAEIGLSQ